MNNVYLANDFHISMLCNLYKRAGVVEFSKLGINMAKRELAGGFTSIITNPVYCGILENLLNLKVKPNKLRIEAIPGDKIVVAKYTGPEIESKAVGIPAGGKVEFFLALMR